jgi:hypothetical protein
MTTPIVTTRLTIALMATAVRPAKHIATRVWRRPSPVALRQFNTSLSAEVSMTILARTATLAALLTLVAAPRLDAQQPSKITVTLTGGAHAGKYEMEGLYCETNPDQFPSMGFTANSMHERMERAARGEVVPKTGLSSISFFTASAKGKPDGFVINVVFHVKAGERDRYEIFTIPRDMYPPGRAYSMSGHGTVTVKQTATGKTASFSGQTKDGVKMEGVVDCRGSSS